MWMFRRFGFSRRREKLAPVDPRLLFVGLVVAIVALGSALMTKGQMSREELAELCGLAGAQQAAQGQADVPRGLACKTMAQFFAQPLAGDRSRIKLAIDKTLH